MKIMLAGLIQAAIYPGNAAIGGFQFNQNHVITK
jgi:hypothetical protein